MKPTAACSEEEYAEQARLREDELMALSAILPATELGRPAGSSSSSASPSAFVRLSVPALLPRPTTVQVRSYIYSARVSDIDGLPTCRVETTTVDQIGHLPALRLLLHLPKEYPNYAAPIVVEIEGIHLGTACIDVPVRSDGNRKAKTMASSAVAASRACVVQWLRKTLVQEWQAFRGEILYSWYEHLKESIWQDILASHALADCPLSEDCSRLTFEEYIVEGAAGGSGASFDSPLAALIRSHDILTKRKEFEGERFGCGICLEEKRGGKCWKVADCGHVFCRDCLSSYLSSMIREGYIRQASACPDPECVKTRVSAENKLQSEQTTGTEAAREGGQVGAISTSELLQFVGPQLVGRLVQLRDKAEVSTDPNAGYCPRPDCERLVRGDRNDVGTPYESMRMCDCGFTYCLYCNKAWHGKSPCNFLSSTALIEKYQKAGIGSVVRREMDLKYGKANLDRMIKTYEEETQNRQYIESNTQKCPCCSVRIEKSMGCNHMICRSCHTHLCYRCGTRLNPTEPYRHFNTPGHPCFQKLFDVRPAAGPQEAWDLLDGEDDEWEAHDL